MLTLYFGHDERVEAGTTAFIRSAIAHATRPLLLAPLTRTNCPDIQEGSNAFTFRRFLVPWYQGYQGWAAFVDGADMLCRSDITDMCKYEDPRYAVRVVKHKYETAHPRKFLGSKMECMNLDYERKQHASVMFINCGHPAWLGINPHRIREMRPMHLLQLRFLADESIGELPDTFNWLCDEHGENPDAKLIHFTAGIPAFDAYKDSPMADEWWDSLIAANGVTG